MMALDLIRESISRSMSSQLVAFNSPGSTSSSEHRALVFRSGDSISAAEIPKNHTDVKTAAVERFSAP
jgi:hypothetical protein